MTLRYRSFVGAISLHTNRYRIIRRRQLILSLSVANLTNTPNKQLQLSSTKFHSSLRAGWRLKSTISSRSRDIENAGASEVPNQRKFTGRSHLLPDELADVPCSQLGLDGLLLLLNRTLRTSRKRDPNVDGILQKCIDEGFDFGMASSFVRSFWKRKTYDALGEMKRKKEADELMRRNAMDENKTYVQKNIPPRRVWDVLSNRVIPYYWAKPISETPSKSWWLHVKPRHPSEKNTKSIRVAAISHSWVAEDSRQAVHTPINGHQWPVPIPKNTTITRIRIEFLNSIRCAGKRNACYAWLDVLCLRQHWPLSKGGHRANEDVRLTEWKLDVPTIGRIYHCANHILYYFTGLGLPFIERGTHSDRHWTHRAWTLQEVSSYTFTSDSPRVACGGLTKKLNFGDSSGLKGSLATLRAQMSLLSRANIVDVLEIVISRRAPCELDKIASLAHLLVRNYRVVPAYIAGEDSEFAWDRLRKCISQKDKRILQLLAKFYLPDQCVDCHSWKEITELFASPSWAPAHFHSVVYDQPRLGLGSVQCTIHGLDLHPLDQQPRRGILRPLGGVELPIITYFTNIVPEDEVYSAIHIDKSQSAYDTFWIVRQANENELEVVTVVEVSVPRPALFDIVVHPFGDTLVEKRLLGALIRDECRPGRFSFAG
jgi:hypothetical protein